KSLITPCSSLVDGRAGPHLLAFGLPVLRDQATFLGRPARTGRPPFRCDAQRGRELRAQPIEGDLAIARLRAGVGGRGARDRPDQVQQAGSLTRTERCGTRDVEDDLGPRVRGGRGLATWAAGRIEAPGELGGRNGSRTGGDEVV